jgi:hypothetical protein
MILLTLCRWLVVASSFTAAHESIAPVARSHAAAAPKVARRPAWKPTRPSRASRGLAAIGCAGLLYGLAFGRRVGSGPAAALAEEHGAGGEPVDEVLAADRPDLPHGEEPGRGDRPQPLADHADVMIRRGKEA